MRWPKSFICPYCESTDSWQTKRGLYHWSLGRTQT
ncbi:MAG: transposase [Deltaproteobacteria bacterium]|nr:transposase [Deltaproteobacteria bacterium]MBW2659466.1 transposase [Deltaproteobacteria bacterium]